jgi:hypothetical protein
MNAFYLAWNAENKPLVWNGQDWIPSASEPEHRAKAQFLEYDIAKANHNALRGRFPRLSIEVVPIAEPVDVGRIAASAPRRNWRR